MRKGLNNHLELADDLQEMGMKVHGFMPHNDGFPLFSRDWEDIDCKSVSCANNMCGKCSVPSIAKLGENGRCEGFVPRGTIEIVDERSW